MGAVRDEAESCSSGDAWQQLADLEVLHKAAQQNHERVMRSLDQASMAGDRRELQIIWNQYRDVVANLSRVTEDIGSLRVT